MIARRAADVRRRGADDLGRHLRYGEEHAIDLSSMRMVVGGGSACPRVADGALRGALRRAHHPGLGHDRDVAARLGRAARPRASRARTAVGVPRSRQGRLRAPASSAGSSATTAPTLPRDGEAVGEIEVRGPWITAAYYRRRRPGEVRRRLAAHRRRRHDHARRLPADHRPRQGRHQVGRRVDLLGRARERADGAPGVVEAAVIGMPDEQWGERPLACVVLREGEDVERRRAARRSSAEKVAKWQLPERWASSTRCPKTRVGKFDKKVLRAALRRGGSGSRRSRADERLTSPGCESRCSTRVASE